jgi:hypothetical protein
MGGTFNTHGEMRNAYKILIGEPDMRLRWGIILK